MTPSRSRKTAPWLTGRSRCSTDSHFPGAVASAGCETRRCHTIAWNSSTWGVRRSGGASMTMQTSASFAVAPSARPTTPKTSCTDFPRELDRANEVHRDVVRAAPAADREDEDRVPRGDARGPEPRVEARLPALVVRPSRDLGDVVGRRIRLEVAQLPEVVDRMRRVCRTASYPRTKSRPCRRRTSASAFASSSTAAGSTDRTISPTSRR